MTCIVHVISGWLYITYIAETSLNRLLLFLILIRCHRSRSVEKSVLKNFTGKCLCWGLFLYNKSQASGPAMQIFFSTEICKLDKDTVVLKNKCSWNFTIFTGKHQWWRLFLIKFRDWRPLFLFKKRLQHRFSPVNIAKFIRAAFL